ncbi:Putative LOC101234274, partial [Caligus rogercresseyi]
RIEYINGHFYGMENAEVTKTLLCFMYEDVVAMVPLPAINSSVIKKWYDNVLQVLQVGFDIAVVLCDAHTANRRFFAQELTPFLQTREYFCSSTPFDGTSMTAKFDHVVQLHRKEMGRSVKCAHKLSDRVLAPQPIERTKVQLGDHFFDDSTISCLMHCQGEEDIEWISTVEFMRLIRQFWLCVTVQSKFAAERKRDKRRKAISSNDQSQVYFLQKFATWLQDWERMTEGTKAGLSRETFMAPQHTANALQELANYLLTEKGFQYALLGKINSDPLEHRFGWYRQLVRANYFISVRQFLEAERKIRFKSLVKVNKLIMTEVTDIFREPEGHKAKINEEGDKNYLP